MARRSHRRSVRNYPAIGFEHRIGREVGFAGHGYFFFVERLDILASCFWSILRPNAVSLGPDI